MAASRSKVAVVLGAMTIGNDPDQARVKDLGEAGKILDVFQSHGHDTVDTARVYCKGTSEEYLGKLDYASRGLSVDTKLYPTAAAGAPNGWTHQPSDIRKALLESLAALQATKCQTWYLHGPDRSVPIEDVLSEVDKLYREGRFERLGVSNYMAWEVAQMQELCAARGWVAPSVYQGLYNCIHRGVEAELLPCLRRYGMAFYAFNPLGGGFFTGAFRGRDAQVEAGSRFDPDKLQGRAYRVRYWNDSYFDALDIVRPVAEKHGLTMAETALRWMMNHSMLGTDARCGDAVLIGTSSVGHLEQNLLDLEKGPLPEEVVEALDKAWRRVKADAVNYFH